MSETPKEEVTITEQGNKEMPAKNDLVAEISLYAGIASIFFAWIGAVPLLAIVLGAIGINNTKEKGTGRWKAIVGLILGIVFFLSNMAMNGHFMSAYDKCIEQYGTYAYSRCNHLK